MSSEMIANVHNKSIWTRVGSENIVLADSVSAQESGGGEGQALAQPPVSLQEAKPVNSTKTEEPAVVPDATQDAQPEPIAESKAVENSPTHSSEIVQATVSVPVEEPNVQATAEAKSEPIAEPKVVESSSPSHADNVQATAPVENANVEVKAEVPSEAKIAEKKEEVKVDNVLAVEVINPEKVPETSHDGASNGVRSNLDDWKKREAALLIQIQDLEKVKNEKSEVTLKMELKIREEEVDLLKARVKNLETELQAALSKPGAKNHEMIENIKQQHEELLSKARGMIFDKTKMVKNQELQIEALTTQVQSLKDINLITKDLLEIRNSEVKAMEDRLQVMEARFKTEKERYGLVLQRAQTSSNINDDLKKEYETQLKIFKELRSKYEQKVEALVAENNKLKLDLAKSAGSGTSTEAPKSN